MITKEIAVTLTHGDILYHISLVNADGTALRARVNGKCKTWKRRPEYFQLPMKHGLRTCFYITPNTAKQWLEFDITEAKALPEKHGLNIQTSPPQVVYDKITEEGTEYESNLWKEYCQGILGVSW